MTTTQDSPQALREGPIGWDQPPPPLVDPPDPSATTAEGPTPEEGELPPWSGPGGGGSGGRTSSGPGTARTSSSPGSSDPADYEGPIVALLGLSGMGAAAALGPDWMPTEDEVVGVARPLARIAARHSPLEGDATDAMDALEAALGLGGYAVVRILRAQTSPEEQAAADVAAAGEG